MFTDEILQSLAETARQEAERNPPGTLERARAEALLGLAAVVKGIKMGATDASLSDADFRATVIDALGRD